jgi:hypothetical protein
VSILDISDRARLRADGRWKTVLLCGNHVNSAVLCTRVYSVVTNPQNVSTCCPVSSVYNNMRLIT